MAWNPLKKDSKPNTHIHTHPSLPTTSGLGKKEPREGKKGHMHRQPGGQGHGDGLGLEGMVEWGHRTEMKGVPLDNC